MGTNKGHRSDGGKRQSQKYVQTNRRRSNADAQESINKLRARVRTLTGLVRAAKARNKELGGSDWF